MKYLHILLIGFLGIVSLNSCEDFLDVSPKTQIIQEEFFKSEAGFTDALTGVYIQMKSDNAYGKAMTMTTIEYLISNWDFKSASTEERLGQFTYNDAGVESAFSSIYAKEYSIIASVNAILDKIDTQNEKGVFKTEGLYELIKGECLALRAYCHFDILRLFGPVPGQASDAAILPYALHLTKTPNTLISNAEFVVLLKQDLDEAENLLLNDPIKTNIVPMDDKFTMRPMKMNYYAVKALKARVYLWLNDPLNAYTCAKEVIDAKNATGATMFPLGVSDDLNKDKKADYTLANEQIFGLYDFAMNTKYTNLFLNGALSRGTSNVIVNRDLYGNTGTDIRELQLWQDNLQSNGSTYYGLKKYGVSNTPIQTSDDYRRIPMLRISEMYLIAVETAPYAEAQLYWDTFRDSRAITKLTLSTDIKQIQLELIKEYRKEFIAEGQGFFAYKRINAPIGNIIWAPPTATLNYVVPLPKGEIIQ